MQRRFVGIAAEGVHLRTVPVFQRLRAVAGALEVFGGDGQKFVGAVADPFSQPARHRRMAGAARRFEHRAVGHLMQQRVREGLLARVGKGAAVALDDQRALLQLRQRRRRARIDGLQGRVPEHRADDAGHLQRQQVARRQRVQPCLQHPHQRGRHAQTFQPLRVQLPGPRAGVDDAVVDQHPHQRFKEKRVALGPLQQQRQQRVRHLGQWLQQGLGQRQAVRGVQRLQVQRAGLHAIGCLQRHTAIVKRRPRQQQQHEWLLGRLLGRVLGRHLSRMQQGLDEA